MSDMLKSATGRELPKKLDGNEAVYAEGSALFQAENNSILIPRRISCCDIKRELEAATSKFVFVKETAFTDYILAYLPNGFKHVFLIRDPTKVYKSFRKVMTGMYHHSEDDMGNDIMQNDTLKLRPMTWYQEQH
nr:uncharacterized protein LOC129260220 [Lytechinus pictus]